ncbi:hypothetical protein J6590_081426 [Homalodisca vitripennis]|nr:hypothetical protein J6590_081426 [Homalodisca vitripennis]
MFAIKCTDAIRALHDSPQICQDEDVLDEPPAEDTINDREAEKSATIIVLESSAGLPEKSSNVSQKPEPSSRKRESARPVKASKYSKLKQKFNHSYDVFTSSINKNRDSDTCFGDYVGESLKKIEDKKVKAWVRLSISNILYQAECEGLAGPFPPIINYGFSNHVHPIQYPPPHMYNPPYARNSSSSSQQCSPQGSYTSPQTNPNQSTSLYQEHDFTVLDLY